MTSPPHSHTERDSDSSATPKPGLHHTQGHADEMGWLRLIRLRLLSSRSLCATTLQAPPHTGARWVSEKQNQNLKETRVDSDETQTGKDILGYPLSVFGGLGVHKERSELGRDICRLG